MIERYSIESIGTKRHPCFYVNDAVNGDVAACRYSLAEAEQAKRELDLLEQLAQMSNEVVHYWPDVTKNAACGANLLRSPYTYGAEKWEDVTCGWCKLEQPAQPVAKNDARYWTAGPGADVLKRDRLLTLLAETTAAREKAAQEVAERSKTLGECLAMERRLTDALRGSQPVAKAVQHLHGLGDKAMCGQPYHYLADGEHAKCPECYKAWDAEVEQKAPFFDRIRAFRAERGLSLLEAQQAVLSEAHEEALTMNVKPSGVAAQPLRKLSPQDFDDRMAGYAARLRQYPGAY